MNYILAPYYDQIPHNALTCLLPNVAQANEGHASLCVCGGVDVGVEGNGRREGSSCFTGGNFLFSGASLFT